MDDGLILPDGAASEVEDQGSARRVATHASLQERKTLMAKGKGPVSHKGLKPGYPKGPERIAGSMEGPKYPRSNFKK
jgi:hypothetical protein